MIIITALTGVDRSIVRQLVLFYICNVLTTMEILCACYHVLTVSQSPPCIPHLAFPLWLRVAAESI